MPPTSDPTRDVLEAARELAACAHGATVGRLTVPVSVDNVPAKVGHVEVCPDCGAHRFEQGEWTAAKLVEVLVDAAREADTFAANVAHAEAHDRELEAAARETAPKRGALVFVDDRLANLLGGARKGARDAVQAIDAAQRHIGDKPPRFEDPSTPERLDASPVRCPLCRAQCASSEELVTVHRCPMLGLEHGAGGTGRFVDAPAAASLFRASFDAAAARLHAMSILVRDLDQVDARAFTPYTDGPTLDDVRTTARARLHEAARAFVEASDELYAATDGERAGGEP